VSVLHVAEAQPGEAADVVAVIRRGFGARPVLEPPSTALDETVESVAQTLGEPAAGGVLARRDGSPVGTMIFDPSRPGVLGFRRVSVDPAHQGHGVASAMVGVAEDVATHRRLDGCWLTARTELPDTVAFWLRRGYDETDQCGSRLELSKALPAVVPVPTGEDTRTLGRRLAGLTRAGDLLVLSGGLGAGKTTLTQGIGAGLRVRGEVTSPTFVIARVHPSTVGGPDLVHADAYRLGGVAELDDLDLDASLAESVTVVEWGDGLSERLAEAWLEVRLAPLPGVAPDGGRVVTVRPHGTRWATVRLRSALGAHQPAVG